ncbi:MAG: hypothetical protein WAV67_00990 [Dokdonella sp.]
MEVHPGKVRRANEPQRKNPRVCEDHGAGAVRAGRDNFKPVGDIRSQRSALISAQRLACELGYLRHSLEHHAGDDYLSFWRVAHQKIVDWKVRRA